MNYQTYEIGYAFKDSIKFVEVVAIDINAAIADCNEAGFEVLTARIQ